MLLPHDSPQKKQKKNLLAVGDKLRMRRAETTCPAAMAVVLVAVEILVVVVVVRIVIAVVIIVVLEISSA